MNLIDRRSRIALRCAITLCAMAPLTATAEDATAHPMKATTPTPSSRLDELYYLQPHNTYAHGESFTGWLDAGYRAVEIDVIDQGDWTTDAKGPYVAHDQKPMKANCGNAQETRLKDCFDAILSWKANHRNDPAPLLVFVDMKGTLSSWSDARVGMLDEYIGKTLPAASIYTYADLLNHIGNAPGTSTRLKLKNHGWPTIGTLSDKIVVVLTGGKLLKVNQGMNGGRKWLEAQGKMPSTFFCPDIDANDPEQITAKIDGIDAVDSGHFICANVKAGARGEQVLNRSAEYRQLLHLWNRSGDFTNKDYAYAYIGVAHGVGALGMDMTEDLSSKTYHRPDWVGSIPFVGIRRSVPGYFTMATEVSAQQSCITVNGAYRNGTPITQWTCATGTDGQQFVYTTDGQLLPKGGNPFCADIKGGAAGKGKDVHLWGCDGGRSEKWFMTPDGRLASRDKDQAFCMDVFGASPLDGAPIRLDTCSESNRAQKITFRPVADWYPTGL